MQRVMSWIRWGVLVGCVVGTANCALVDRLGGDADPDDTVIVVSSDSPQGGTIEAEEMPPRDEGGNASPSGTDVPPVDDEMGPECLTICKALEECGSPIAQDVADCLEFCAGDSETAEALFTVDCMACMASACAASDDFGLTECRELCDL